MLRRTARSGNTGARSSRIVRLPEHPLMHIARLPLAGAPNQAATKAPSTWQRELREAVRDPRELCQILQLPAEMVASAIRAAANFPLFAPRPFLHQVERGNPADPLLRQILPLDVELVRTDGFSTDP